MYRVLAQCITAISVIGCLSTVAASQQSPEVRIKYKKYIEKVIIQYDEDLDGKLSQVEVKKMSRPPVDTDTNKDGFLNESELVSFMMRFSESYFSSSRRSKYDDGKSPKFSPRSSSSDNLEKYRKYAQSLIKNYDKDKDGKLNKNETKQMRRPPAGADENRDGFITEDELLDSLSGANKPSRSSPKNDDKNSPKSPPDSSSP